MKNLIIFISVILKVIAEQKHNFNLGFFQNDYHIVPEWFEVVSFDKKYVKEMKTEVHKYNRTVATVNLTITYNVDVGNDIELIGQIFKFSSNEYREFPARMQFNFCQAIKQDFCGLGGTSKCGNFTGCPFTKGRKYHFCNWTPNESKMPPYFPSGRYMAEVQGMHKSTEMYVCRAYGAVTRPEVWKL